MSSNCDHSHSGGLNIRRMPSEAWASCSLDMIRAPATVDRSCGVQMTHRSPIWLRVRSVFTLRAWGTNPEPTFVGGGRSIFQDEPDAGRHVPVIEVTNVSAQAEIE